MADSIADLIREVDFYNIHQILLDNSYYDVLFPFLLVFAVTFTILQKVKLFQTKSGSPIKSVIFIVSLIFSFFGVSFDISPGHNVGSLLMVMIPNISTLTMGVLTLYIVGAILGQNFFKGVFAKDTDAYLYFAVGAIGLGSIIFYVGISMGFWDYDALDPNSLWTVVLAVAFFILAIVFAIIGLFVPALLFGLIFATFVYNSGEGNILELFIDPVIFVFIIFVFMISWLSSGTDKKKQMAQSLRESEKSIEDFIKENGKKPDNYDSRIFDIMDENFKKSKKDWEKSYGSESWK